MCICHTDSPFLTTLSVPHPPSPPPHPQDPEHDVDVFNGEGVAPLHLAARGGHMGAVAFLLQKGSSSYIVDMQDWDVSCVWVW